MRAPSDVLRLIVGVLLVLIGLLFAGGASNTLVGFERDLISARGRCALADRHGVGVRGSRLVAERERSRSARRAAVAERRSGQAVGAGRKLFRYVQDQLGTG